MIKDLTGQRFGRLVALEHVGFTKNRNAIWNCQCDCGTIKNIVSGNLTRGTTNSCGCLFKEIAGSYHKLDYGEAAFNDLYSRYRTRSLEREYLFNLSTEDFRVLTKQNCYYCNSEPNRVHKVNKRVGKYIYNGVDRIDNSKGYSTENCVSCCYTCNRMKHAMSKEEFLAHIGRIYNCQKNINLL